MEKETTVDSKVIKKFKELSHKDQAILLKRLIEVSKSMKKIKR
uniref:Uncharacterized protein n=1 Tax=viral metagenome TaxID=1070528 RepID=A0A6M3JLD6_9ZZZZ